MATKRLLAALAAAALPALAGAHEVLHSIERGRAIAVRAWESDGDPLAGARYEVYSPSDPKSPWQDGHTDRGGWLAFAPDVAGKWRVRVLGPDGHGLDLEVDAGVLAGPPAAAGGIASAAFVLRPLAGLLAIGAVFAALFKLYRRKGAGG